MNPTPASCCPEPAPWSDLIPADEWRVYQEVIDQMQARGIEFALGGAFAVACHTGFWRNTKDIDLYILPRDREAMIELVTSLGFDDLFDEKPYDREWIYRSSKDSTIVDVIWAMANHHSEVDGLWMTGPSVDVRGYRLKSIPVEAMVFDKLYIMQRERCDWPDVLNLLYWTVDRLDWSIVLRRLGPDWPLLAGVLSVFRWISPARAALVPAHVWEHVRLPAPDDCLKEAPQIDPVRASLLDRRPWYGPDRVKLQPAA
jgi:predicted nucleotidyltransferase